MEILRGNYKIFKFQRKTKSRETIKELPDKMYFTVKESTYKKDAIFQKKLNEGITYSEDDNYYRVEILQDDTENMAYGTYEYDIKIIYDGNKPKTLIVGTLEICEVVTHKANEV